MNESWSLNILNKFREGRLAHAFLFETNDSERFIKELKELLKQINCLSEYSMECTSDCNLCSLIENETLPSLVVIRPDGASIKKDQINELMKKFSTKPIFSRFNMYIVLEADRLNSSAANSLLKFLEEPTDDIIGFFVTNNRENVISTIKSRCQVVNCHYEEDGFTYDEVVLEDVKIYLNTIYKSSNDLLYNKTNMSGKYPDRSDWEIFFKTMLFYFLDTLESNNVDKIELINNTSFKNRVNMINLVKKVLEYIKFNGNIDLILDKFVIEMRKYYG